MAYDFDFDLTKVSRSFFQKLAALLDDKEIHRKMGDLAEDISEKFRLEEVTGIPVSNTAKVVNDLIDIHVRNLAQKESFEETENRALFLPHCARKHMDDKCQADFNKELSSYSCKKCSSDCLVNRATEIAEEEGYDVYVLPGGSCIPRIIQKKDYEGIVGVACPNEIKMGEDYLDESGIPHQAVPLLKNGCSGTKFNLDTFKEVIESSDSDKEKSNYYLPGSTTAES